MNIPKLTDAQTEARACYVIYRLIDPVFNQIRYVGLYPGLIHVYSGIATILQTRL
jgi:hypothetical protein